MPGKFLRRLDRCPRLDKVRDKGVPQRMEVHGAAFGVLAGDAALQLLDHSLQHTAFKCMERTLKKLQNLQKRVATGKLREAGAIGASAQRALTLHHGHRYYGWGQGF